MKQLRHTDETDPGQKKLDQPSSRNWIARVINVLLAALVAGGLLYVAAAGAGPLPPLGAALNPGTGVWTAANTGSLTQNTTLHLPGLHQPVTVVLEKSGIAHISATDDADLFWTMGYLHATFRLFQMDLLRRQGEGQLSELFGKQALTSDRFEDTLGLDRTAQADWNVLAPSTRQVVTSYAQGVNARINEDVRNGTLPMIFKVLGYRPRPWTPLDTFVVQGDMTQTLDFSTTPLDYAMYVKTLGYQHTMQWFPVFPPDTQHPYDVGPYKSSGTVPLATQQVVSNSEFQAVSSLQAQLAALPTGAIHYESSSNNWAVDGTKTASGKPLLAGDPHLHLTLPSIWYQVEASSPHYSFSGVSIPGLPVVLIGHNQHISWSLTDVQNQSTMFYVEKTDKAHPGSYYWRGSWQTMKQANYSIPVKGGAPVHLTVNMTVHGPVMTQEKLPGETISVAWIGAQPSPALESALGILQATNFTQFRDALRSWVAPSQNFVYADEQGNIGMISAGTYPLVKVGSPWLPLPGTGEADIVGSIPFDAIPQVYNPPDHIVFSANQRPVGKDYPYYIGTTLNDFDNGYRADEIYTRLSTGSHLTMKDMEALQNSTHDYLAGLLVPHVLKSLPQGTLTSQEQGAQQLLQTWNGNMDASSPAASLWWTFLEQYVKDTFQPWWNAAHVPAAKFPSLVVDTTQAPLVENIEAWTLHDPTNAAFSLPNGTKRSADTVMQQAFKECVAMLTKQLGANVQQWTWGRLHAREIASLLGYTALSYGPHPSGGDQWTLNAAGGAISAHGPSWRFIMDWGSGTSEGVYPGGQDENPVSPWYDNLVATWWDGRYYPMLTLAQARSQGATWTLLP